MTEGFGVSKAEAYPALVEKELTGWKVVNSGISGSTSASAPGRMKWALKAKPAARCSAPAATTACAPSP